MFICAKAEAAELHIPVPVLVAVEAVVRRNRVSTAAVVVYGDNNRRRHTNPCDDDVFCLDRDQEYTYL